MRSTQIKVVGILLAVVFILAMAGCTAASKASFQYWEKEAPALSALQEYVQDVTNEKSENYIPTEDRIAVFDMDGTLYGEKAPIYIEWLLMKYRALEDPNYDAPDDVRATAEKIVLATQTGVIPEELEMEHAHMSAKAYAGMTIEEYKQYVKDFTQREAEGFDGITYAQMWYKPMLEVVDYLNESGFKVYICSGTDRIMCRTLGDGVVNVPEDQFIGMDVFLEASGQQGTDGLEYVYTEDDQVVRTDKLIIKNVKANKVSQIAQEIGCQPVLAFGNSNGDVSMLTYTTSNNPYRSAGFMLIADDEEREYGDAETATQKRRSWEEKGWEVISMRDDFKTIYGENVTKVPAE